MPIPRKATAERKKDFVSRAKTEMRKNDEQHHELFRRDFESIIDSKGGFLLNDLNSLKLHYLNMATEATVEGDHKKAALYINMHALADAESKNTLRKWKESLLEEK